MQQFKKGFTHAGSFHSDDVFSTAFLQILCPEIEITRGFQAPDENEFDGIIYDIGWGKYDHHQKDRRVRENGVPFAAFGLLFDAFGTEVMTEEQAKKFDEEFIQQLDLSDNTGCKNPVATLISEFNPTWKEKEIDTDERFFQAVKVAKQILENKFKKIRDNAEACAIVREEMKGQSGPLFILEKDVPWHDAVQDSEILYVVYESNRGGYNIQVVEDDDMNMRKPLPEEWRGQPADILQKLTGVASFRFCHNSGFLAAADTKEDAIKIAWLAIEK